MELFHGKPVYAAQVSLTEHPMASRAGTARKANGNNLFNDALSMASTLTRSRKQTEAKRLKDISLATREFSATLEDFPHLRSYADAAADGIDSVADYVEETELQDMVSDLAEMARRQPLATMALTIAAGVAAAQIARSMDMPKRRPARSRSRVPARRKRR
jgi:hypothetical protein